MVSVMSRQHELCWLPKVLKNNPTHLHSPGPPNHVKNMLWLIRQCHEQNVSMYAHSEIALAL